MEEKGKMTCVVGKIDGKRWNQGIRYHTNRRFENIDAQHRKKLFTTTLKLINKIALRRTYTLPRKNDLFSDCIRSKNESQQVSRRKARGVENLK